MKYIEKFDRINDVCYWLLPTDDRFEDALKEIGCYKDIIKIYLNSDDEVRINNYIFVGKNTNKSKSHVWGWNPFEGLLFDEYYDSKGYTFNGTIMLRDDEIEEEMERIKMLKNIKKYNL